MEQANVDSGNDKAKPKRLVLWFIFAIIAGAILLSFAISQLRRPRSIALNLPCKSNLMKLGNAIVIYAYDNQGQFPTPEKWCDLLMSERKVSAKAFICPDSKAKKGQSSYAFNKNLVGIDFDTVGPDTLVLFESKPGWNQIAGPNSWNPANHEGKGCNVLYRNGSLCFERSPEALKWTPAGR
jgi:hypothetical protein